MIWRGKCHKKWLIFYFENIMLVKQKRCAIDKSIFSRKQEIIISVIFYVK
jgi:hypothetical protein